MLLAKKTFKKLRDEGIEFVDFRFTNIVGKWQHTTYNISAINEQILNNGITANHDFLLRPDLKTLYYDLFTNHKTAVFICERIELDTKKSSYDVRSIAIAAEQYLRASKVADDLYITLSLEFYIFDDVQFQVQPDNAAFNIKTLQSSSMLLDNRHDIRSEISLLAQSIGIPSNLHFQCDQNKHCIVLTRNTLTAAADNIQKLKHLIRNLVASYGKSVVFMPKILPNDPGLNLRILQEIAQEEQVVTYYIGGIINHARAINAFSNPIPNSYKQFNAQAMPAILSKRQVEIHFPDPMANIYLTLSAMLLAGLDGIKNKINLPFSNEQILRPTAFSLQDALSALDKNRSFLTENEVFDDKLIDDYINAKKYEISILEQQLHPAELKMYYNL